MTMLDMTPLILVRIVTLFVFSNCVGWCVLWMLTHRRDWLYAVPILVIFVHATAFYSFYLADFFGLTSRVFVLQTYADWGGMLMMHIACTSLFIMLDLVTNWFTRLAVWMAHGKLIQKYL